MIDVDAIGREEYKLLNQILYLKIGVDLYDEHPTENKMIWIFKFETDYCTIFGHNQFVYH